jgi:hypothetical protein
VANLGPPVNTGFDEAGPSVSADGLTIFFNDFITWRPGGNGNKEIWIASRPSADQPFGSSGDVVNISPVDSRCGEYGPHLSPSWPAPGSKLYFNSVEDRMTCAGFADLYEATWFPERRGNQIPGDCNQDGGIDLSDAICVFGALFLGNPARFPCGGGSPSEEGNLGLIDWQPDGEIDLSDGVALLQFLFLDGPAHALAVSGRETDRCVSIPGCPASSSCESPGEPR